jgi:riboflavin synthase
MFTGLIKEIGTVQAARFNAGRNRITIKAGLCKEMARGDSIAVNGVCLTAAELGSDWFSADVMPETLRATNLKQLQPGDPVNLEPALALGDRFGGHMVSGHVDGTGKLREIRKEQNAVSFRVEYPRQLASLLAVKGSIALNGVSLTIQELSGSELTISLIPHTIKETTFYYLKSGAAINIEADMLARQVVKAQGGGISAAFLEEHGFK